VTAKTFRTWSATLLATSELRSRPAPKSQAALKRQVNEVLEVVAHHLGNTAAVCRKSYVDPRVIEAHAAGKLQRCAARANKSSGLTRAECELVAILEAARQAERKAA